MALVVSAARYVEDEMEDGPSEDFRVGSSCPLQGNLKRDLLNERWELLLRNSMRSWSWSLTNEALPKKMSLKGKIDVGN